MSLIDARIYQGKPTWWVKVIAIILASAIITVILLYSSLLCQFLARSLHVPLKWVVFALVSFAFTLIIGPTDSVHSKEKS